MIILSHRGFWKAEHEKNMPVAFKRSWESGFGLETDVRDYNGELVISHNIADHNCPSFKSFLEIYKRIGKNLTLALNVKADGLQEQLKKMLEEFNVINYFVFDMSVPDGLIYIRNNFKVFSRHSEYENPPSFYESSGGVWLDEFHGHWITEETISDHLLKKKKICIVSPELHKRPYKEEWNHYRLLNEKHNYKDVYLCTDYPEQANKFFN